MKKPFWLGILIISCGLLSLAYPQALSFELVALAAIISSVIVIFETVRWWLKQRDR